MLSLFLVCSNILIYIAKTDEEPIGMFINFNVNSIKTIVTKKNYPAPFALRGAERSRRVHENNYKSNPNKLLYFTGFRIFELVLMFTTS